MLDYLILSLDNDICRLMYVFEFFSLRFWSSDFTPKYGNCYTFNSMENAKRDLEIPRKASLTGRDYGIFFILQKCVPSREQIYAMCISIKL